MKCSDCRYWEITSNKDVGVCRKPRHIDHEYSGYIKQKNRSAFLIGGTDCLLLTGPNFGCASFKGMSKNDKSIRQKRIR